MLPRHLRIAEAGLALTAVGSVLAFGGVQIHVYSMMQLVVLLLTAFVLWSGGLRPLPRGARIVVAVLAVVPLLQLAPLPRALASLLSPMRVALHDQLLAPFGLQSAFIPISISTYLTISAFLMWSCYLAVFVIGYHIQMQRAGTPGLLIVTLVGLAVFEGLYGMIQYLADWDYIFWYRKWAYIEVATGTYVNRNSYAFLLALALPYLLALILERLPRGRDFERGRGSLTPGLSGPWMTYLALFIVAFLGLMFSHSRMGLISAAAGLLTVIALTTFQRRDRTTTIAGLLVLAVAVGYAYWIGLSSFAERFALISAPEFERSEARFAMWRETAQILGDFPLTGTGLGTYPVAAVRYQEKTLPWSLDYAHNDYLQYASEIGLAAAVLLFGCLWYLLFRTGRFALNVPSARARVLATGLTGALLAALLHATTEFNFHIPANALLFAWVAGTAAGLCHTDIARDRSVSQ